MNRKSVLQLDNNGYFVGFSEADESPLEPGVFLFPANTLDANVPNIPEGKIARWTGDNWTFEDLPPAPLKPHEIEYKKRGLEDMDYSELRVLNYPSIGDQLDALFHAGVFPPEMAAQIQAIKDQFPKY